MFVNTVAVAGLSARQQRLFAAFQDHLAARGVRIPSATDFETFGSLGRLEDLAPVIAIVAPSWHAECRIAIQTLRAEKWRQSRDGVTRRVAGPPPEISVPLEALPRPWRRALADMTASRRDIDRGVMCLEEREPPAASVIRSLTHTLRQLVYAAHEAGLRPALDIECVRAFLTGLGARERKATTRAARLKELITFARWIEDDTAIEAMRREKNRQARIAERQRKHKELWLFRTGTTVADCWLKAEELLASAMKMPPGLARRRLELDALAIAFAVVSPLRIGDLHRIRIGVDLVRRDGVWRFTIDTVKTGDEYDAGDLWPELVPFIDAVVLDGRHPFDLASRVKALEGAPLFSKDGVRPFAPGWISTVWRRHIGTGEHIIRTLWHEDAAEDGETWIALALCGQRSARTAKHYTVKAARKQAARRGRALMGQARRRLQASAQGSR